MMQTMVLESIGTLAPMAAPVPSPGAGEALVRVTAVGVCGSDMHLFSEGMIGGITLADAGGPFVPGHEAAGVVEAVGPGADAALVGRRVAIDPAINCERCPWCLAGKPNVCPYHHFLGLPPCGGALRQYIAHPARLCVPVEEDFSDDLAVLTEPLAIGIHALDRVGFVGGQGALVLGAGPIGLTIIALLAAAGCDPIVATDKLDYRLGQAERFGASVTLNPTRDDVEAAVAELSGGHGLPYVFEAAGAVETFEQMIACAAPAGKVAVVGIPVEDRMTIPPSVSRRKGLDVLMIRRSNLTLRRAIAWARPGRLPIAELASHHWPLNAAQEAYQTAAAYADGVLKAIINPHAAGDHQSACGG